MILVTRMWYQTADKNHSKIVSRNAGKGSNPGFFQSHNLLCYTRERVKRAEKAILQRQQHSVYIQFRLPPWNHSSCSDLSSESHPMILHTTSITPYQYNPATSTDIATPQATSLSYLIILPPSLHILPVCQSLRFSVKPFLPYHPRNHIQIAKYLHTSSDLDIDDEGTHFDSANNFQQTMCMIIVWDVIYILVNAEN